MRSVQFWIQGAVDTLGNLRCSSLIQEALSRNFSNEMTIEQKPSLYSSQHIKNGRVLLLYFHLMHRSEDALSFPYKYLE